MSENVDWILIRPEAERSKTIGIFSESCNLLSPSLSKTASSKSKTLIVDSSIQFFKNYFAHTQQVVDVGCDLIINLNTA